MRRRIAALGALAAAAAGCMDLGEVEGDASIGTHVADWRGEVVYQVLTDRFANGDLGNDHGVARHAPARYHGGDWRGIEERLPYLERLGVTAIWISPVVKNVETDAGIDGYHGYWTQDLLALNPHFGDLASLRRMVRASHARRIKVILDIVTNHLGQLFFYDINMNGRADERLQVSETLEGGKLVTKTVNEYDPEFEAGGVKARTQLGVAGPAPILFRFDAESNHWPPSPEVFLRPDAWHRMGQITDYGKPEQVLLGDFPGGLKDVATENADVRRAMVDVFVRWVKLADFDGFRIDTVKHVEHEFWQAFAGGVRERLAAAGKRNFLQFGEAFDGDPKLVGAYTKNSELDAAFNFPQYYAAIRNVFRDGAPTRGIEKAFKERLEDPNYGDAPHPGGVGVAPKKLPVNFLDNHDVARFLFGQPDRAEALRRLRLALLFLFTEDGIPCVYYGTEQGFSGGNDPGNREDLWTTAYDESGDLFRWIARLSRVRRGYRALTHGDLAVKWASDGTGDEPDAGLFAFERTSGDAPGSYALVVLNSSAKHPSTTESGGKPMPTTAPGGTVLVDAIDGKTTVTVGADGTVAVTVPALGGVVLVPQKDLLPIP